MNQALLWITPILIGYVLGSIPFGYVIVRVLKGIDIREYGSHNIGATNVLRVVGWFPALLTLLGDVGKGLLPPIIASLPVFSGAIPNDRLAMLSALAAIWGHAYSAYFYLKERKFARGKAVAAGLGALIGFVVVGRVAWPVLAIVAGTWVGTVFVPKLFTRRFGFVSLASVLAAVAMPVSMAVFRAPSPYIVFGIAAASFVLWKHKENIGRLIDGVEPRLGEKPPLAGVDKNEVACAFLIHALTPDDWLQPRRFALATTLHRAGLLPLGVLKRMVLLLRPVKVDTIRGITTTDGRSVQVHLICVPWLPEQIKAHPERAVERCAQAARLAKDLGARCLGLGSYWSVVGNKGLEVQQAAPFIPITNGGGYTAGTVKQGVPIVLRRLAARGVAPEQAVAAVVGANGVVGFGICRLLVGRVRKIIMVGTDLERLEKSAGMLRRRAQKTGELEVETTTDLARCREAQLIFTATSTVEPVVFPEHVAPNAILYDIGRPADVADSVKEMPGVTVIPGGVVRPPGDMEGRIDVHFGEGCVPACMGETLLVAIDECYDRVSLGDRTKTENIDYFVELAERLGFQVVDEAAPQSRNAVSGRLTAPARA